MKLNSRWYIWSLLALCQWQLNWACAEDVEKKDTAAGEKESKCKVSCLDPHACCSESEKVLDVLQLLTKAYTSGDLSTYEKYLDDHCTTFDERTKKLVVGKQDVLTDLKKKFEDHAPGGAHPLVSFTIDQPYAKVTGDTCVVTFVAYREIGGKDPLKEECNVTDVFVKRDGIWKKLHYRGRWKKASS